MNELFNDFCDKINLKQKNENNDNIQNNEENKLDIKYLNDILELFGFYLKTEYINNLQK